MARSRRKTERTKKRVKVEFGTNDLNLKGYTEDISVGGLLLRCRKLLPINTRIHMKIAWPDDFFYAEGVVVRQKLVPAQLRRIDPPAMGIRFLTPAEVVDLVIPRKLQRGVELTLTCSSDEEARKVINDQLAHGVLMVPVGEPPPVSSQIVEFAVAFSWKEEGGTANGRGRVVQLLDRGGGQMGAVIEVEGAQAFCQKLTELLDE